MKYRLLGNTGLTVSEIGFGTWQLGGISWNSPTDPECIALLHKAFDRGINLFDVSPSYGNGRSEMLAGSAFHKNRDKIIITGKVGVLEDGTYHGFWSERQLVESLEQSLRRLRTDYLDFVALHTPPMDVLKSGYALELLRRLKEKGKARFIGVSIEAQPEEALIALEKGIDVLQIRFNLLFPEARRVFAMVARKDVGLIINSPLAHGYLSGRYQSYEDIDEGDYPKGSFRASKPHELVEGMINKANAFRELSNASATSLPEIAIKFILAHDIVSSVIPGHRSLVELESNLHSANDYLSYEELQKAETIYRRVVLDKTED
jgi:aryl-alcohol dehydrogenase-like predicted oxidoreductase